MKTGNPVADRIRAMSDDELAMALLKINDKGLTIPFCKDLPECIKRMENGEDIPDGQCVKCMMEWMKKGGADHG